MLTTHQPLLMALSCAELGSDRARGGSKLVLRKAERQLFNSRKKNYFLAPPNAIRFAKEGSGYCHRCGNEEGSSRLPFPFLETPWRKEKTWCCCSRHWGWALGNTPFVEISVSFQVRCL